MRLRLPVYVVNCLLAAGYDVIEVISNMDFVKILETLSKKLGYFDLDRMLVKKIKQYLSDCNQAMT